MTFSLLTLSVSFRERKSSISFAGVASFIRWITGFWFREPRLPFGVGPPALGSENHTFLCGVGSPALGSASHQPLMFDGGLVPDDDGFPLPSNIVVGGSFVVVVPGVSGGCEEKLAGGYVRLVKKMGSCMCFPVRFRRNDSCFLWRWRRRREMTTRVCLVVEVLTRVPRRVWVFRGLFAWVCFLDFVH
ncbi:hypothetical protein YC2023_074446 [Brassica napus]